MIMRLVDRGKLTEEEAVAILAERKGAAKSDPPLLPAATPEATYPGCAEDHPAIG